MQTITRIYLCKFSCSNTEEVHLSYSTNAAILWGCIRQCKDHLLSVKNTDNLIVVYTPYNKEDKTYITIAGYKGNIFCGLYSSINKKISFEDRTDYFEKYEPGHLDIMETSFKMSCIAANENRFFAAPEVVKAWTNALSLLDKVIAYHEKVGRLPEYERNREDMSLRMEETIDAYVREYENGLCLGAANTVENSSGSKENAPDICEIIKRSQEKAKNLPVSWQSGSESAGFDMGQVKKGTADFSIGETKNAKSEKDTPPVKSAGRGWSK